MEFHMRSSLTRSLTNPRDGTAVSILVFLSSWLFFVSESACYGDSTKYAFDVRTGALIEPGHLLWRPFGHLLQIVLKTQPTLSGVLWHLQFLCLIASVLTVIAMYVVASRMYGRTAGFLAATLMAVSNGFWAYSFSGCSYSLSVLFAILALRFAISDLGRAITPLEAFTAGIFGGLSAATWAVQVLAAPAIWLSLMLTPARDKTSFTLQVRNTVRLIVGYLLAFAIPVLVAYLIQARHVAASAPGTGTSAGLGAWLSSSSHGIPAHYGVTQVLRVAMGWPQSVVSTSDIGPQLRFWHTHEAGFPTSPWLGAFVFFYAALMSGIRVLASRYPRLDGRDRGVIVASAAAIAINLTFAAFWQGTDLERYFPSWPFQLLLSALVIKLIAEDRALSRLITPAIAVLTGIAVVNWYGTFEPVLAPDSFRNAWLRELRSATSGKDLVIVFGQRTRVVESPHEPDMPRIDNVSTDISMRGDAWRFTVLQRIAETKQRGGRVFLADSLFGTGTAPRDGWSFKEYPRPTPYELQSVFLPFKSNRLGFTAAGERVWIARD
jgi:hypothetical protein